MMVNKLPIVRTIPVSNVIQDILIPPDTLQYKIPPVNRLRITAALRYTGSLLTSTIYYIT